MKIKQLLLIFCIGVILFPSYLFYLAWSLPANTGVEEAKEFQNLLQTSLWVIWVLLVSIAVYYKWTTEKNFFFIFTYIYLSLGFLLFGIYTYQLIADYTIQSSIHDASTFSVLIVIQNLVVAALLTGFLQISAWWFTRRLHRR